MRKNLKYISYLARHKWFVLVAGLKLHVPLWLIVIHDLSKLLPSEWKAYLHHFYDLPCTDPKCQPDRACARCARRNADWMIAWRLHKCRNRHHWEFWLNPATGAPFLMPEKYVREMVADWAATGRTLSGRWEFTEWWATNKHKIVLDQYVRKQVEGLVEELAAKVQGPIR